MSSMKNPAAHSGLASPESKRRFLIKMVTVLIGGMVGRYRTSAATLGGPYILQDPITRQWAIYYCVKASTNATFHPEFKAQAIVSKTPTGWHVVTSDARYQIGCTVNPRPFPEFDALTNKLAAEQGR